MLFSQEAVDVDTQRASTVQHGGRQPRFSTALDYLLQALLQTVGIRSIQSKATDRSLDFTDTREVLEFINPLREIFRQTDLMFDRLRVTFAAHELHRHPQFQRV